MDASFQLLTIRSVRWPSCTHALRPGIRALLLVRLLRPAATGRPHPRVAGALATLVAAGVAFAAVGPFQPGWNAIANNGNGSGGRGAYADAADTAAPSADAITAPAPFTGFDALLAGTVRQGDVSADGTMVVALDACMSEGALGTLRLSLEEHVRGRRTSVTGTRIEIAGDATVPACTGGVTRLDDDLITAACVDASGRAIQLLLRLSSDGSGTVRGTVSGRPLS